MDINITALLFIVFGVLLFLNVPIAFGLGIASLAALILTGTPMNIFPVNLYTATSKFMLLAIPFFIIAGNVMEKAGISDKLINFANKVVGHQSAGLANVCVITSCFFAAISGSGPATVAALGVIVIPAMVKAGYGPGFSSALMATAGGIGVIIPPSISFVIFGVVAEVSIGKLFIAGIIPGILIGFSLIVVCLYMSRSMDIQKQEKASPREVWIAFKDALWGLMMPVIILGGIYGGVFTPTEAAAVSVVYGLLVGIFVYKAIKFDDFVTTLVVSSKQTAVVMFIVANASLFAWVVATEGVAQSLGEMLLAASGNVYVFLLIINIILLIAGCFLDGISAMYIFVPIILPVALKFGYDPVALGVVMVVNLAIGLVTPPVGVNLYVACGIAKIGLKEISKHVAPFVLAAGVALFLMTYIPEIILWLPNFLGVK